MPQIFHHHSFVHLHLSDCCICLTYSLSPLSVSLLPCLQAKLWESVCVCVRQRMCVCVCGHVRSSRLHFSFLLWNKSQRALFLHMKFPQYNTHTRTLSYFSVQETTVCLGRKGWRYIKKKMSAKQDGCINWCVHVHAERVSLQTGCRADMWRLE